MQNGVFFPQAALDQWIGDGTVDLQAGELTLLPDGRRYKLADAVRVVREVGGVDDPHELVGRVKALAYLEQLGAEIVENSMLLGDNAYDVELGWLGIPSGTLAEHVVSDARKKTRGTRAIEVPKTEEDILAQFLEENL